MSLLLPRNRPRATESRNFYVLYEQSAPVLMEKVHQYHKANDIDCYTWIR
jgi:hypothetical protein